MKAVMARMAARAEVFERTDKFVSLFSSSLALVLTTFRRKKPFSDDRATNLGARTRRQVAADKL
jgi:hypothetical protein